MKRQAFLLFTLVFAHSVTGQSLIEFAPWEFGVQTVHESEIDSQSLLFSAGRVVPLSTLLPQVTGDSHLNILGIAFGARWVDESYDRLRFRLTGAQIALQRAFTSGGITVLDYNQTGVREKEATWLGLSFGPSVHFQRPEYSAWLRIIGKGNLGSIKNGHLFLLNEDTENQTGLLYEVAVESGITVMNKFMVEAAIERENMPKADLEKEEITVRASFRPTSRISFSTGYSHFDLDMGPVSARFSGWNVSLRFSPSQIGY